MAGYPRESLMLAEAAGRIRAWERGRCITWESRASAAGLLGVSCRW